MEVFPRHVLLYPPEPVHVDHQHFWSLCQQCSHSTGMCSLQGIDVIWESVGGDMFRTCTKALGQGGRLIVIGMMSQYADGWGASEVTTPVTLSACVLLDCGGGICLLARCQQKAMHTMLLWLLDAGPQVRHLTFLLRNQGQRFMPCSDMID